MSGTPDRYWKPWLGERFNLRPCDLGDLTAEQLEECWRINNASKGTDGDL